MRALILLLRYSGLRIGNAVTHSTEGSTATSCFLRTLKTGTNVYCPFRPDVVIALEAAPDPNQRFYFSTGNGKVQTITGDWQAKLKDLFERAKVKNGHAHRFRDTFAVELRQARVAMDRVSILLGHSSINLTERHYNPWGPARSNQSAMCEPRGDDHTRTFRGGDTRGTPRKRPPQLIQSTAVGLAEREGFEPSVQVLARTTV